MRRLTRPFWIFVALVFLFEAWLWEHLRPVVAWIVDRIAWARFKAWVANAIGHLGPYPTLLVFLIPVALLVPLKFVALWMLARGSWLGAMATLVFAKVVGMGVAAFILDLTRPKLLQLPWFRWFDQHVLYWLARAHALVDPIKIEIRNWMRRELQPLRRRLRRLAWLMRPRRAGRFMRRLARIRRLAQTSAAAS